MVAAPSPRSDRWPTAATAAAVGFTALVLGAAPWVARSGSLEEAAGLVGAPQPGLPQPRAPQSADLKSGPSAPPLPTFLHETGLYAAGSREVDPRNLRYTPQYPLWSDGAEKRRWVRLPEGTFIDARRANAWEFPIGTRFWKEFRFDDRRVETRYIERLPDGGYRYATYVWSEDQREARLAPSTGVHSSALVAPGIPHQVPGQDDCRACHEGRRTPILGFNALQLSPERDPNALHAEPMLDGSVDLRSLVQSRLIRGVPEGMLRTPPRIRASSPKARAALGYLYGNCSGCHNAEGPLASLDLDFDQRSPPSDDSVPLPTAIAIPSRFPIPGAERTSRIEPGSPDSSSVTFRMASRFPAYQMPPIGTRRVDDAAVQLLGEWIAQDLVSKKERNNIR